MGELVAAIVALVVVIVVICLLYDCYSAAFHCAVRLDEILDELRNQRAAPPSEPPFCQRCGQPGIRSMEMGREVAVCPTCRAKL